MHTISSSPFRGRSGGQEWRESGARVATGLGLTSCNVTRVITNESQYLQRGNTSVVIQTKTVETYDAVRKK